MTKFAIQHVSGVRQMKSAAISELEITNPTDPLSRVIELIEKRTAAATEAGEEEKRLFRTRPMADEQLYADQAYAGNFSKTLPHDPNTGASGAVRLSGPAQCSADGHSGIL
jgi:hypothetical protein